MVVVICKTVLVIRSRDRWRPEDFEIVLVLEDWPDLFSLPDVDDGITDHTSIATRSGKAKRVVMINIELAWETLHN